MIEHLRTSTVSVVLDVSTGVPVIRHWGRTLDSLPTHWGSPVSTLGAMDVLADISVVPMHGDGFSGRPGLQGHRRGGHHWSPRFQYVGHEVVAESGGFTLSVSAQDAIAQLQLLTRLDLTSDGVLRTQATINNIGATPFMLDAFTVTLPLPAQANELAIFAGRWIREFQLQRFAWPYGAWTSENRSGRTSHEHPPYLWAMQSGASEWNGQVWGIHSAWSGNHVLYAEVMPDGRRYVQAGELFHAGEMCVYAGESCSTAEMIGTYSDHGLTPASWGLHREARRRFPREQMSPRPVHLNTWEAMYFDHEMGRLQELADSAAEIGIERFVLDDGWFGGRRNDRSGLGDWWVSEDLYPQGLTPLIDHVRSLGMQFGIWVEPEMVNPDSDLFRAHPEWMSVTTGYEPVLGRNQLVLDLTNDEARGYIVGLLDALLRDHEISYVKWDMNRWHVQGSDSQGKANTHDQTLAVYSLLDELRSLHPLVEFESCASGGGRIDHAILTRVERVWTSDCNDALDRQLIQRGASMIIPPEVMGSHIGSHRAHTTGRRHSLALRGATALFGHLGVESDITKLSTPERQHLAHLISLYKQYRGLLHSGDTVRFETYDLTGGTALAHGVYCPTRAEALLLYVQLATDISLTPPMWLIPDLRPDSSYQVTVVPLTPDSGGGIFGPVVRQPDWIVAALRGEGQWFSGRHLEVVGLQPPVMMPESAVLVRLSCA